jgi:hypothetical protein
MGTGSIRAKTYSKGLTQHNIDTGGEFTPLGTEERRSGNTWFSQEALRRFRMRFSIS